MKFWLSIFVLSLTTSACVQEGEQEVPQPEGAVSAQSTVPSDLPDFETEIDSKEPVVEDFYGPEWDPFSVQNIDVVDPSRHAEWRETPALWEYVQTLWDWHKERDGVIADEETPPDAPEEVAKRFDFNVDWKGQCVTVLSAETGKPKEVFRWDGQGLTIQNAHTGATLVLRLPEIHVHSGPWMPGDGPAPMPIPPFD
ncbi:hypothetical protein OAU50_01430 [Planctomycetota bacterium]|nr:hypothetical protein [Planctomycetota bacterium]